MVDTVAARPRASTAESLAARSRDTAPSIETEGLTKRYGDKVAVDGLTLTIERGEVFGLLGPNGAGKTTTILMLLGLTEPSAGKARVDGLDPARDALRVKHRVGYLPDDVGFYDDLTGRQNLSYTAALNRLSRNVADQRIERLLDEVGLAGDADRKVRGYSRGMRQRLGLADALVKNPSILILDEPTVNIDPAGVRQILGLVDRLRTDEGVTVLLSSHLLHQVEQVCDRIGIFVNGRLEAVGRVDQLAQSATDRWVIDVEADGHAARIEGALTAIPGVRSTTRVGDRWRISADRDVRSATAHAVTSAGGTLTYLSRHGADLDGIYLRYFHGDGHDDDHADHEQPVGLDASVTG